MNNFGSYNHYGEALEKYTHLLLRWNSKIQMTATRNESEFVERHVLDSLELADELGEKTGTMIDVGSGGGLPGIVLAIVCPNIHFTLIEPTKKKHAFLSTARRELKLSNVRTLAVRDTELIQRDDFERFDFAIARAVWSMDIWFERAKELIVPGGTIFSLEATNELAMPEGSTRRRYRLQDRERSIVSWTAPV
ncbi:MAG: 16S rRNA (guanine(527)-N(7))-methyltransferase RsmG [Kofleriaceae bacterium]|nr:16S rRNA (guanine(527)-N(7))-methyltransferase RsmG [Kofleriaceae bacterium]